MNQTNQIIIKKADFDYNYLDVAAEQIKLLLQSGNVLVAFNDVTNGQVTISYLPLFGDAPKPYWLTPEEVSAAQDVHDENEYNYHKMCVAMVDNAEDIVDTINETMNKGNKGGNGGNFDA